MLSVPLAIAATAALAVCVGAQREVPSRSPRRAAEGEPVRSAACEFQPTAPAPRQASGTAPVGEPRRAPAAALQRDRETVRTSSAAGTLWARGANYKLRIEGGSVGFVPFLASYAPRNQPLELALREVSVGGTRLRVDWSAPASIEGTSLALERGACVERYDLAPRTAEQSFVFASLPRRGELLVRMEVSSELAPRRAEDGWRFEGEFGYALYGPATAFDADGRALALETTLADGVLSIAVPAEFVERARLPLVIDPVLASFGVESTPVDTLAPDVTFDAAGSAVLYCWEEVFSASDHDVWADAYTPSGNPLYRGDWIDMTAAYWGRPRSANVAAQDRFLIVANYINSTTGRVEVWGRTRSLNSPLLSPQFKITGGAAYDVLYPDVGGDPYPTGPSYFLVAYERVYATGSDHDVHARLVSDAGTLYGGVIGVDTSINTYDIDVSVSKSNGSNAWNLAWQRASPAGGNDILAARVAWDGIVTEPTFGVAVGPLDHTAPAASSCAEGGDLWVCVYEEDFGSDHDLVASGLDGAALLRTLNLSAYDGPYAYQDQRAPSVDSDGVHFALSYSELYQQSPVDYDVYVSEVLFNGVSMSVLAAHQPVFQTDGAELESQIASAESSAPAQSTHDYALAWHREPDGVNFASHDIMGASFRGTSGGQVASFCDGASVACPCGNGSSSAGGCPNSVSASGALLTWSGQPSTTQDTLQFFVSGMPGGTSCLFFQGANALNGASGSVYGDGVRCAGLPMRRLGTAQASVAGASLYPAPGDLPISVKGQVPPAGTTLIYQVWYRNSAAFCSSSTTNLSNALVVAWTP